MVRAQAFGIPRSAFVKSPRVTPAPEVFDLRCRLQDNLRWLLATRNSTLAAPVGGGDPVPILERAGANP